LPAVAPHLRLGAQVVSVARRGFDKLKSPGREAAPFVLRVQHRDGNTEHIVARAVIDASGTWTAPNRLGADGLLAEGETYVADRIRYGIPDVLDRERDRYAGRRVLVVGSGHSAFNALLDLVELATQAPDTAITWAIRGAMSADRYGVGAADALPARGQLGDHLRRLVEAGTIRLVSGLRIAGLRPAADGVEVFDEGDETVGPVDETIAATGFRPDLSLARELRLALDPAVESPVALAPLIDANVHSCGTVPPHAFHELGQPERDFYTVGMKSYGRAPTFLLLTGYEPVRTSVAARDVKLTLPETGVCSGPAAGDGVAEEGAAASCCGTAPDVAPAFVDLLTIREVPAATVNGGCCDAPAPAASDACCARDAEAKAAGETGCGCGEAVAAPATVGAH
jgi:thioredoxin reductase